MSQQPTDIRVELTKLLSDVDQSNAITADKMHQLQTGLDALWQKTEGDTEAQDLLLATWENATQLAEQNAALSFQVIASGNIAQSALAEEKIAREELGNLQDAIANIDEEHPVISDLIETIREDEREYAEENLAEWAYSDAMEVAYDDTHDQFSERIKTLTGCDWQAAARFLDVLFENSKFTPEEAESFKSFIAVCDSYVRQQAVQRRGA